MDRRNFIKAASCGALPVGVLPSASHAAAEDRPPTPRSLEMLYDSALCVGYQAYVTKRQDTSSPERNPQGEQTWPNNNRLSLYTNDIVQVWTSDIGISKNQEENGYVYIKRQCMHCVDPNCVSVCPVSALKKDPKIGIVHYDKGVCIDCRCCMTACSYNMPKYDYNNPFDAPHKCGSCDQKGVERLDKGDLPGYVEVCPAGAVIFGMRKELMMEVRKCSALKPGGGYHYPRRTLKPGDTYLYTVSKYCPCLYGEKEGGNTQVLVLTDVPCEDLGLSRLDDPSTGVHSRYIQHTLCKGMMLPLAVLAGLTVLVCRNTRNDHHDGGDGHES